MQKGEQFRIFNSINLVEFPDFRIFGLSSSKRLSVFELFHVCRQNITRQRFQEVEFENEWEDSNEGL
jgi:antitoxin component of MazEF toxin-antitoxin module